MTAWLERNSFYGDAILHRKVGCLDLTETAHAGGSHAPRHAHEHPYLCLVVRGGFHERFGGRLEVCGPGTVVLHPAGEEHADHFDRAGAWCFNVQLEPGMLDALWPGRTLLRTSVEGGRPAVAAARLRRCIHHDGPVALEVETVLLELLETIAGRAPLPSERRAPPWLGRVVDRLRASGDAPPRISALAAEHGIHPVHLARTFRRFLGASPLKYLDRVRLERSTLALSRSTLSVARVAADAGFADHSHFCRRFRRAYGITPSAYRRMMG